MFQRGKVAGSNCPYGYSVSLNDLAHNFFTELNLCFFKQSNDMDGKCPLGHVVRFQPSLKCFTYMKRFFINFKILMSFVIQTVIWVRKRLPIGS